MNPHRGLLAIALAGGALLLLACKKTPNPPDIFVGPASGVVSVVYNFTAAANALDDGVSAIQFTWGDGDTTGWSSPVAGGDSVVMSHSWAALGSYDVKARAKSAGGVVSGWSAAHRMAIVDPEVGWTRTFGGGGRDEGRAVQQTADGGYIVTGLTYSFGAGGYDAYLVRVDAAGDTIWTRTFGGAVDDAGSSVQQTADGGYITAGHTWSYGAGEADVYLIKSDASGNPTWARTFGDSCGNTGSSVQQTSDGGYIIAGCNNSSDVSDEDVCLIKADASGDTVWTRTIGGSGDDWGSSVQQTADGGYIIAGVTKSRGAGGSDVYLVKTDGSGDTTWTRTFGGSASDQGCSVQQTADGGYVIAGWTCSFGAGDGDVYLVKTNGLGDTVWTRTYGGSAYDDGRSVQQTTDGGYIIAGGTWSFGVECDLYLIKTDASGSVSWSRTFGGNNDEWGYSVRQTADGGYVVAGCTDSYGAGDFDVYLIKTNADGKIEP